MSWWNGTLYLLPPLLPFLFLEGEKMRGKEWVIATKNKSSSVSSNAFYILKTNQWFYEKQHNIIKFGVY